MTPARLLLLALAVAQPLYAQRMSHPVMSSRDDARSSPRSHASPPDTVRILAAMAQFQADTDNRTSGDGRFVLTPPAAEIIDAPPRNRAYFEQHLLFLENYYRRVSRGAVTVRWTVVDSVFTLAQQMEAYSPRRGEDTRRVADLARDTWAAVGASGLVPDFSAYNCFVVFHAGVGRDVDLAAELGYDPTPFDIPSLYFGLKGFQDVYGPDFQGFPVPGGLVQNSIVLPETENRTIPTAGGDFLLELGINGLLCASVGNWLGLPDLFNTATGASGIGRFGLMDGQSIFSWSGVFPPEPSAWEKYWLGWVAPFTAVPGTQAVSLPADIPGRPDSVLLLPIGPGEYFLVENRNRDPRRNGQTVTAVFNGATTTRTFPRDTTGFNAFDVSALAGVVTDAEDFDWSLPGGVAESGEFFDGGLLVWHVDEEAIARGLAANGVNADPARPGVDLEEADGSQDIGQQYEFLSPGAGSEAGTALDFWYRGNPAPVYRNTFDATTFPNSASARGAASHVTLDSFSVRGPQMTFTARIGDGALRPVAGFPRRLGEALGKTSLAATPRGFLLSTAGDSLSVIGPVATPPPATVAGKAYAWTTAGTPLLPGGRSDGLIARTAAAPAGPLRFGDGPTLQDLDADGLPELLLPQAADTPPAGVTGLRAFSLAGAGADSLAPPLAVTPLAGTPGPAAVAGASLTAVPASGGLVYFVNTQGAVVDSLSAGAPVAGVTRAEGQNAFLVATTGGRIILTTRRAGPGTETPDRSVSLGGPLAFPPVGGLLRRGDTAPSYAAVTADGRMHVLRGDLSPVPGFPVAAGAAPATPPAFADVDGDGSRDLVFFSGTTIRALNAAGASLDFFPVTVAGAETLASPPVVADVDGDGSAEIAGVTSGGLVVAYGRSGRMAAGFPLQAGQSRAQAIAVVGPASTLNTWSIALAVASADDGTVSAWTTAADLPVPPAAPWPQFQGDAAHSGFASGAATGAPSVQEFFPASRAYNWPNPVYDGKTRIRYYVRDDATVSITIYDFAGDLVAKLSGPGVGGLDNEVEWDASGVQNGVYFARIEAAGQGGSGVAVVKVAVVK